MEVRDVFTDLQPSHLSAFESRAIHWLPGHVLFVTKDRQTPGTDRQTHPLSAPARMKCRTIAVLGVSP